MQGCINFYQGMLLNLRDFVASLATTRTTLLTYMAVFVVGMSVLVIMSKLIKRFKGGL